jgi:hypothetical protein
MTYTANATTGSSGQRLVSHSELRVGLSGHGSKGNDFSDVKLYPSGNLQIGDITPDTSIKNNLRAMADDLKLSLTTKVRMFNDLRPEERALKGAQVHFSAIELDVQGGTIRMLSGQSLRKYALKTHYGWDYYRTPSILIRNLNKEV